VLLAAIALAMFLVPFVLFARPARGRELWSGSAYFGLVGLGFMLLELPWIQVSILFLGHPSYAATVVLAALLLGAGAGAALVSRWPAQAGQRFWLVPLVAAGVTLAIGPLFRGALGWPFALRVALAAGSFGLAGLMLGSALPIGFIQYGEARKAWFWAVNGAASVLASAGSLALAMSFGFSLTALAGSGCYAVAAVLLRVRSAAPR